MDTRYNLLLPIADKAKSFHHITVQMRASYRRNTAIWLHIAKLFVFIDHRLDDGMMGYSCNC